MKRFCPPSRWKIFENRPLFTPYLQNFMRAPTFLCQLGRGCDCPRYWMARRYHPILDDNDVPFSQMSGCFLPLLAGWPLIWKTWKRQGCLTSMETGH